MKWQEHLDEDKAKMKFAMFAIGVLAILQGVAWCFGQDGEITKFVTLGIGTIIGAAAVSLKT